MSKSSRFTWPALLAVIGVGLNIVAGVTIVSALRDSDTQMMAPGEMTVSIAQPSDYTLWNETKTVVNGQFMTFPNDLPPGTTIKVFKQPEGTPVPLQTNFTGSMESGNTKRIAVGQLTFDEPGQYRIAITGLTDKRAFYLDEAKFLRTFFKVMLCGLLGILFLIGAVISGIIVAVRSSKRNS